MQHKLLLLCLALCLALAAPSLPEDPDTPAPSYVVELGTTTEEPFPSKPINVFLIPHSHWDVGWLSTPPEYYNNEVLSIIRDVMRSMKDNQARKFVFSEVAYMQKWWEEDATETEKADFKQYLDEGRLEFVQGGYTMPDEALNTYNAVIQTITRGHEWIRDVFGTKHLPKTAWRIDPFGSTTTMSKLYKDSGYNSTYVTGTLLTSRVIMRMPRELQNEMRKKKHLEIMWQTTSGKIFTHIMDLQYCVPDLFERHMYNPQDMMRNFAERYLGDATGNLLFPMGCDFSWKPNEAIWRKLEPVLHVLQDQSKYNRRYNVQYATVADYMKVVNQSPDENDKNFITTKDEFLPYNDGDQAWWTGYYSSYPTLKREARKAEALLHSCNQIYTLYGAGNTSFYDALEHLRRSVSEVTHHDGITGTSKKYVVYDYYITELQQSSRECLTHMGYALSRSTKHAASFTDKVSKTGITPVIVYNNLAWARTGLVSLEIPKDESFCVYDTNGNKVPSQTQKITSRTVNWNGVVTKTTTDTLLFTPSDVQALGYKTYFASICNPEQNTQVKTSDFSIGNSRVGLKFCKGIVGLTPCAYTKNGVETLIEIEYLAYHGVKGGWGSGEQGSGAYIFNPVDIVPSTNFANQDKPHNFIPNATLHDGPCQIVEQTISPYLRHEFKICKDDDAIRYTITAGGAKIPRGLEIVTRMYTPIKNDRTIYCDKNGLETRKYDYRSDVSIPTSEVAASFLPMVQSCFIRDSTNLQFTILTSQAQAASSQIEGSIEVMVYRVAQQDDGRGLGEALDDDTEYSFTMMLYLENKSYEYKEDSFVYPIETLEHNYPLLTAVSTPVPVKEQYAGESSFGAKLNLDNVHLLSLDTVADRNGRDFDHTVVRLHNVHTSEKVVSIESFLKEYDLELVEETTLASSRSIGEPTQQISLRPNQIRTFIAVKSSQLEAYNAAQLVIQNDKPTKPPTTTAAPTTKAPTTTTTAPPTTTQAPSTTPFPTILFQMAQNGSLWFFTVILGLVTVVVIAVLFLINSQYLIDSGALKDMFSRHNRRLSHSATASWDEDLSDDEPRHNFR